VLNIGPYALNSPMKQDITTVLQQLINMAANEEAQGTWYQ